MTAVELSEVIRNYTTALAVVGGGLWALWRWGYSDWGGARKNRASLDGHLTAQAVPLGNGRCLVTVSGQWNNRGQFPVAIDPDTSQVSVYELPQSLELGAFDPSGDLGEPLHVQQPFEHLQVFELEPKTESALRAHFVLASAATYFIRWTLYKAAEGRDGDLTFQWSKELVWCCPSNPVMQPTAKRGG